MVSYADVAVAAGLVFVICDSTLTQKFSIVFLIVCLWRQIYAAGIEAILAKPNGVIVAFLFCLAFILHWTQQQGPSFVPPKEDSYSGPLKPLVFPCQTTHTRLFPKIHSFAYSYLQVGIPIGWQGSVATIIGAEEGSKHRSWFNIDAADYLARGDGSLGFKGKLQAYLETQVCIEGHHIFFTLRMLGRVSH
jgi:hypothetical protein